MIQPRYDDLELHVPSDNEEARPRAVTDNRRRRKPFPGEGYLWAAWHRIRGHRVERWGYSISHGGSRHSWYCLGAGMGCGRGWPS